jgi:hypothetical protein
MEVPETSILDPSVGYEALADCNLEILRVGIAAWPHGLLAALTLVGLERGAVRAGFVNHDPGQGDPLAFGRLAEHHEGGQRILVARMQCPWDAAGRGASEHSRHK